MQHAACSDNDSGDLSMASFASGILAFLVTRS